MALFTPYTVQYVDAQAKRYSWLASGFTLVELLVVIAMIGILFVGLTIIFNPGAQINKSQNAVRQHDLEEIKTSLDTYYDDTGCYPTDITFDRQFSFNNKIYMNNVPEDPLCQINGSNCYTYQTDTSSDCPQWNVLYTTLQAPVAPNVTCPLKAISSSCVPKNYQTIGANYCVVSGNVDCSVVSSTGITPVPPPGGVNNPTPTPTPAICPLYYACTGVGANGCNSIQTTPSPCKVSGGNIDCYCDVHCRVNNIVQCH